MERSLRVDIYVVIGCILTEQARGEDGPHPRHGHWPTRSPAGGAPRGADAGLTDSRPTHGGA